MVLDGGSLLSVCSPFHEKSRHCLWQYVVANTALCHRSLGLTRELDLAFLLCCAPLFFFFFLPQNLCAKWVEVDLVCTSQSGFNVTCYGKLWQKYVVTRSQQLCWLTYWWFTTTVSVIMWQTANTKFCVFVERRKFSSMRPSWVTMLY